MVFHDQPHVVVGSLLCHRYSSLFEAIADESSKFKLFEGKKSLPVYRADVCLSEIFIHVGKIIIHCIAQHCKSITLALPC